MTDKIATPGRLGRGPAARPQRVLIEWLAVACLSTAMVVWLIAGQVTVRADNVIYDALSKAAVHKPLDDIVIVGIDNRSVGAIGRWPWPRERHAQLLEQLARMAPKAVAYDVLFLEPDRRTADDEALAEALRSGAPTYLPLTFDIPGANGAPFEVMPPIEPLRHAAAGLGQTNVELDQDGVVRRTFLTESDARRRWPHLMQRLAAAGHAVPGDAGGSSSPPKSGEPAGGLLRSDPVTIAFAGPAGTYRTISAVDILRGETPAEFLRGKLVLVGATADGLGDRYATPLSSGAEAMSGVELQANLLDTLITGRAIRPLSPAVMIPLSLTPLALLLIAFLRLSPRANMVLGIVLIGVSLAVPALLFLHWRIWAPPVAALAGLLAAYPLWSWRRLEASSAYMLDELKQFAGERDLWAALSAGPEGQGGDRIARQVTLLHRAIAQARDARSFVTDTLQGLPDPVLVVGLDGRIVFANREADMLFHQATQASPIGLELTALTAAFAAPAEGSDRPGGDLAIDPTAREMTAPGGRTFSVRATPLTNAGRQAVGRIVRFTDISDLKAASDEREQVLQLLTHDMRSPQVSILTLLDHEKTQSLPRALAERIAAYARRTLTLADNFVHLARAEQSVLDMEPVDLGQAALDAIDDLWPQSTAKTIAIKAEGCEIEHLILADRGLLTRALINLLHNAIKFTEPGGVVSCCLTQEPGQVVCTISDNGCGMPAERRDHLFRRFGSTPRGAKPRMDGVGLGLSFVEAVIARHAGTIACESGVGAGTTFTLRFPLRQEEDAARPA